ncbi:hypothetical protein KY346_04630 [Candidatus Woesearchaeota archaeon]|nr:hypothetical protein [Candidatus Woesearchaeota archaeon]
MEVVEIVVFIGIAVLIGGFILTFLIDWDVQQTYEDVKSIVFKEHDQEIQYKKVDKLGFMAEIYHAWQDCGFGMLNKSVTFYVSEPGELTKEEIFTELKKLNYCRSLQSAEFECGTREDLEMDTITLPAVINARCEEEKLKLTL